MSSDTVCFLRIGHFNPWGSSSATLDTQKIEDEPSQRFNTFCLLLKLGLTAAWLTRVYGCLVGPSRRGDLEILGYCLLHWSSGSLPWMDRLQDDDYVGQQKEKYVLVLYLYIKFSFGQTCKHEDRIICPFCKFLNQKLL